jgi:uncharacterized membrane protein YccC
MPGTTLRASLRTLQWQRGLRAAIAVGSVLTVCHALTLPPGAAALGAFDALLVDNGGPYRTRLITMAVTIVGGALVFVAGALVPANLAVAVPVTIAVCFVIVFARVLSQPLASPGVLILVLYFAGLGGTRHTLRLALLSAAMVILGGLWAVLLSLVLWPVDPFRPARVLVAGCYQALADFATRLASTPPADEPAAFAWQRRQRTRMEAARAALAATSARAPSRTIRARNLTVLLETADLLLARTMRLTELTDLARSASQADGSAAQARLADVAGWLSAAEGAVFRALLERPGDAGAAFCPECSQRLQFIGRRREELSLVEAPQPLSLLALILAEEQEALLELEIVFDAVSAIWTGTEVRRLPWPSGGTRAALAWDWTVIDSGWQDALRANWTTRSAMLRHALRVALVGAVDVIVMRLIRINHGFWLPMTSIILLQPYSAGTARKSMQRVSGTVAGGVLAAVLAAAIPSSAWMLPVVTLTSALTLASFAVDYALYTFFLTPTFVLLSLPHPHDWRYAGVRIGTTLAGALIALAAMRLVWPERAEVELGGLLRRGAAADAAYLRAMLRFWEKPADHRARAEREILAPARRACGLASNDAEEAVDRVMQEPRFGSLSASELRLRNDALTFATYLRRLTQSITTLAAVGRPTPLTQARLERVAGRMERIAQANGVAVPAPENSGVLALVNVAEEQIQRIERQAGILERTAAQLNA